jgi:hypothetical protein
MTFLRTRTPAQLIVTALLLVAGVMLLGLWGFLIVAAMVGGLFFIDRNHHPVMVSHSHGEGNIHAHAGGGTWHRHDVPPQPRQP